jgi:hypothetical protein
MSDPFRPEVRIQHELRGPFYRIEQHETEEDVAKLATLNARIKHDPFWRTRFWSVQHVRDVIEGKAHHWFWSPIKGLTESAAVAFAIMPFLTVLSQAGYRFNIWGILAVYLGLTMLFQLIGQVLHWLYWWRFTHIQRTLQKEKPVI